MSRKRKSEADKGRGKRKRFVWPEALHKQFIAAVFDAGLRSASPKAVMMALGEDGPDIELVQGELNKFRMFRQLQRGDPAGVAANTYAESTAEDGSKLWFVDGQGVAAADQISQLQQIKADRAERIHAAKRAIQAQSELVEQSLTVLNRFQGELSQAMINQARIRDSINARLGSLGVSIGPPASSQPQAVSQAAAPPSDPTPSPMGEHSATEAIRWDSQPLPGAAEGLENGLPEANIGVHLEKQGAVGVRQRAKMQQEMMEHMNMHRTMEMHMRDQLAQYGSPRRDVPQPTGSIMHHQTMAIQHHVASVMPPEALQPADEDGAADLALLDSLDDQLFEFLKD